MIVLSKRLLVPWGIIASVLSSRAQQNGLFQWGFGPNEALTTLIPACFPISIVVFPTNVSTMPAPPFYMMSFALGGFPVTNYIGTDPNNLTWTVTQPVGSQLAVSVVDANGNPGGVPPQIYSVVAGGQSTNCDAPLPASSFTLNANVTSPMSLTTCEPWGLTIQGGVPPYTVTLVQPNSPNFTNVTVLPGFDVLTYINRANPNGQLIAAASDSTGTWASHTAVVDTTGGTDFFCGNLETSSGTSNNTNTNTNPGVGSTKSPQGSRTDSSGTHHTIVIAISIALVAFALIVVGAALIYAWKRKHRNQGGLLQTPLPPTIEPSFLPAHTNFQNNGFEPASLYSSPPTGPGEQPYTYSRIAHSSNPSLSSLSGTGASVGLSYPRDKGNSWTTEASGTNPRNQAVRPGKSNLGLLVSNQKPSFAGPSSSISSASVMALPSRSSEVPPTDTVTSKPSSSAVNTSGESEAVFQHRDAGPIIEVPPPYSDDDFRP